MALKLHKIDYAQLNPKQQENYNYAQLSSLLAKYGYNCIRLSDDHNGADLIARHADGTHVDIQLKGRFTLDKKYLGKNLFIAFPYGDTFYVFEHDLIVKRLERAGVINFVVITAALSSCNAGIFSGGRLLYALSVNGYAPEKLTALSVGGVPHKAVILTVLVAMAGVALNYFAPSAAFHYAMAGVTFIGLMVWVAILYTQLQFRRSLSSAQRAALEFKTPWWPYSSWFALAFIGLVIAMMAMSDYARAALIVGPCLLGLYFVLFFVLGLHRKNQLIKEKI
jgi:amino acid transporter